MEGAAASLLANLSRMPRLTDLTWEAEGHTVEEGPPSVVIIFFGCNLEKIFVCVFHFKGTEFFFLVQRIFLLAKLWFGAPQVVLVEDLRSSLSGVLVYYSRQVFPLFFCQLLEFFLKRSFLK